MRRTTRQKLVKRLFPTAVHLSPISLMILTHLLFQLFLSPFRRLCAFLGRPLMTNLRNSTARHSVVIALILPVAMRARLKVSPPATSSFIQLFEKTPIHTAHEPDLATPSISCRSSSS
jgi:hypothetical protein